jgi:pimeloyl-ACP methyl ester carboxylesterase
MAKNKDNTSASDYIESLNMNHLQGRMLRVPATKTKKREILFIYGHHSSLERWWGLVQILSEYGNVTVPDLPGFGGMESFYKIGEKPTLDNYADYLAAFVKLRYNRKRLTIIGMSFGFLVATRMLQRYPELTKRVDLLISIVGFSHKDDFKFSRRRLFIYRTTARVLAHRLPAMLFRGICLQPTLIRALYSKTPNAKHKFADLDSETHQQMMDFEIHLWHANDVRTHWFTTHGMLTVDNCHKQISLPVWHVTVKADQYFDDYHIEQHMRIIFTDFNQVVSRQTAHAPSVIADAQAAAPLIPAKIRRLLSRAS